MSGFARACGAIGEFGRAFLLTVIPIIIVSIISTAGYTWLWAVAASLIVLAVFVALLLRISGKKKGLREL